MSGDLLSDQTARDVQRDGGHWRTHGYTQNRHTASFNDQIYRVYGGWLLKKKILLK